MQKLTWAKAAVLDASYLHGGRLDLEKVRTLAEALAARGAQLWLPEVVVLEFAVHAWEDLTSNRQSHKRLAQAGVARAQDALSDQTSSRIADQLLAACSAIANVVILRTTGELALEGLRDQILRVGAGTIRQGVRTGAADSVWIRAAFNRANNHPRAVVFLTGDVKGVERAGRELGWRVEDLQIWNRTGSVAQEQMLERFFGPAVILASPPSEPLDELAALHVIVAALRRDYTEAMAADDRSGPPPEWIEVSEVGMGVDLDEGSAAEIESMIDPEAEVEPWVRLVDVAVSDVYPNGEGDTTIRVDYVVRLLADVRVEGQRIDNDGKGYWDSVTVSDRLLRVPYTAEIREGELVNPTQTDTADNYSAAPRFDDNYDAYWWLFTQELSAWDHITIRPADEAADLPKAFAMRGPQGRTETVALSYPADLMDDWTVEFEATRASISASYDHTARAALGRRDSFDVFPPASLSSETAEASRTWTQPYTALAEVWAYLIAGG